MQYPLVLVSPGAPKRRVLTFDDSVMGLHELIEPLVVFHTVPHVPWQQNLRLPKATQEAVMEIKEDLDISALDIGVVSCSAQGRNRESGGCRT